MPFNAANAEKGKALYENSQPIPRRRISSGKDVAVLGADI